MDIYCRYSDPCTWQIFRDPALGEEAKQDGRKEKEINRMKGGRRG
jgi:hypothetical protein